MPESYVILRNQRPVGHGFFHEGTLRSQATAGALRWIYDCGGGKRIKPEVREYLAETKNAAVDLLFLSHLHADHVNGLPELLKHTKVKHAILPHLTEIERILILARTVADATVRAWFVDFIRDPAAWLAVNGVDRVTQVVRGNEPPADTIDPDRPQDGAPVRVTLHDRAGRPIGADQGGNVTDDHSVVAVDHQVMLRFFLYVRPAEIDELERLRKKLGGNDLLKSIASREGIRAVRQAFAAVWDDINWTSLCVACLPQCSSAEYWYAWDEGNFGYPFRHRITDPGWLGLGDAVLKSATEVGLLKSHFGPVLERIGTYSLPHHGSDENYCEDLLRLCAPPGSRMQSLRYVTAKKGSAKHPSASVRRSCKEHGVPLHVVTEERETAIVQYVVMQPK